MMNMNQTKLTMKSYLLFFKDFTLSKKIFLLMMPLMVFLGNMQNLIFALCLLMTIDLITGIRKFYYKKKDRIDKINKKVKKKKKDKKLWLMIKTIKSHLLRRTWKKMYECLLGIMIISIFEVYLLGEMEIEILGKTKLLTEWALVTVSGIEVWSIFENIEAVSGHNPLKRLSKLLPEKLRQFFEKK